MYFTLLKFLFFTLLLFKGLNCYELLFSTSKSIHLLTHENNQTSTELLVSNLEDVSSLDYLHDHKHIFWSDFTHENIKSFFNKKTTTIFKSQIFSNDVSADWINNKLYWIEKEGRIEVSELDGRWRSVLVWQQLSHTKSLVLHPTKRLMLWVDCGAEAKVEKASMDGSDRSLVINTKCMPWSQGMALDTTEDRFYMVMHESILTCTINGTACREMKLLSQNPFTLSTSDHSLFWVDWNKQLIMTCFKPLCSTPSILHHTSLAPRNIKFVHPSRRNFVTSPCDSTNQKNGGCSHLCLLTQSAPFFSCACPIGIKLLPDGKTCVKEPSEELLVASLTMIRRISLDTPDFTPLIISHSGFEKTVGIEFDGSMVYWSDLTLNSISRSFLNGSGVQVVIAGKNIKPELMVVDWLTQNLYWVNALLSSIEVTSLNNKNEDGHLATRSLVFEDLHSPRALTLDLVRSYIFWSDWGNGKIEVAFTDGSGRKTLVSRNEFWPNGLSFDSQSSRLYWGDAKQGRIEYINLKDFRLTKSFPTPKSVILVDDGIQQVFGFSIIGNHIYWSDRSVRSVARVDKWSGGERLMLADELPDIMAIKAIAKRDYVVHDTQNVCRQVQHDPLKSCQHICLMSSSQQHVCTCAHGYELNSDQRSCFKLTRFLVYGVGNVVYRVTLETGRNLVLLRLKKWQIVGAVGIDNKEGVVYIVEVTSKTLRRLSLDGTDVHVVRKNFSPKHMAVDAITKNIYWTEDHVLFVSDNEGRYDRIIAAANVTSIAIDPKNGWIFWTNHRLNGTIFIEKSKMDGFYWSRIFSINQSNVSYQKDFHQSKISLDITASQLFLLHSNIIIRSNYGGKVIDCYTNDNNNKNNNICAGAIIKSILRKGKEIKTFEVNSVLNSLYVVYDGGDIESYNIKRENDSNNENNNKNNNKNKNNNNNNDYKYYSDIVDLNTIYEDNSCDRGSGCQHLCFHKYRESSTQTNNIDNNTNIECSCASQYELNDDGKTCRYPDDFILIGQNKSIIRLSVSSASSSSSSSLSSSSSALPSPLSVVVKDLRYSKHMHSLHVHTHNHTYTWVAKKSHSIFYLNPHKFHRATNKMNARELYHNKSEVIFHSCTDQLFDLIYYSEINCNCIQAMRLDGSKVGKVIVGGQPRYLAIASRASFLFWTTEGKTPRIERSLLDGTSRVTLFSTGIGRLGHVQIDYKSANKKIFHHAARENEMGEGLEEESTGDVVAGNYIDFNEEHASADDYDFQYNIHEDDRDLDDYADNNYNEDIYFGGAFDGNTGWRIDATANHDALKRRKKRNLDEEVDGRLYWIDLELRRIEGADFDGGNRRVIVRDMGHNMATGLVVIGGWLLWSSNEKLIERVNKTSGEGREVFYESQHEVSLLASSSSSIRGARCPAGACSHFCMEEEGTELVEVENMWRCSCPLGMQLQEDAVTCKQPNKCSSNQFTCVSNGLCIDILWRCDRHPDCLDKSDEVGCLNCTDGRCGINHCVDDFQCENKEKCLEKSLVCDSKPHCSDGSDEKNCLMTKSSTFSTASYVVGLGLTAVAVVVASSLTLLIFVCRRKSRKLITASKDNVVMVANATTHSFSIPDSNMQLLGEFPESCHCPNRSEFSFMGKPDGSSCYDRDHLTGASSTTGSELTRSMYDPPPSLISQQSESTHYSNKKRRKRHKKQPGPTTCGSTCTEDVSAVYHMPPPTPISAFIAAPSVDGSDTTSFMHHPHPPPAPPSSFRCLTEEYDDDDDVDKQSLK